MKERRDEDGRVWIQGGTARIPAPGEPGGGPPLFDDTPPELKEHLKREENKDNWSFRSESLAQLYGDHYTPFAEALKTMGLGDAKGFTDRSLEVYDADVVARAKAAPSDEARQRFVDDAMDLRRALETKLAVTESTFKDMRRRSDLGLKAGALARQARAYPEDYALHAAVLDKVADGAMPLVKRENAIQFRRVEAEKMARSAVMGLIEQGRFDEGRALLDGGSGALPLSPEAVKELGGVLETRRAEAAAREERLDRVDTVIEGTAGPTEDADEWVDLVEEHYAVVAPQLAELEPAERIEVEDDYVRKLGHLPVPLTRSLRAGMLSGEPEHEAAAALRIAGFAQADPALIEAIPEVERAAAIAEFAELGLKPERAVELGDEKLTNRDKLLRPDDPPGEPTPEPYRPGYVWENGDWRPETPQEKRNKNMLKAAEQSAEPAADGASGNEAGGDGGKAPDAGAPAKGDDGGDDTKDGTPDQDGKTPGSDEGKDKLEETGKSPARPGVEDLHEFFKHLVDLPPVKRPQALDDKGAGTDGETEPRLRIDPETRWPTVFDMKTGKPVLAPDGKPFTLDPERAGEIVDMMGEFGKKVPREMTSDELKELHEFSRNIDAWMGKKPADAPGAETPSDETAKPPSSDKDAKPAQEELEKPEVEERVEEDEVGTAEELMQWLLDARDAIKEFMLKPRPSLKGALDQDGYPNLPDLFPPGPPGPPRKPIPRRR